MSSWICPTHAARLARSGDELACARGCRFEIRKGIPRFVPRSTYADAFGLQWLRYRQTQLDSHTGLPLTQVRLRRCLGEGLWNTLNGAAVLEAGCGAGRFTEVLLDRGATVTSIDLSDAVEANQDNFPQGNRHRIAQASLLELPLPLGQFDIVVCVGVVQHTPSPERSIAALWRQVKSGGWLVFDHYTYNLSYYTKTAPLLRVFLKRMEPARALRCTEFLVRHLLPLHRGVRRYYWAQALLSRVSPVQAYYHALPDLDDASQEAWALLDTHDTLTDWYKHFRSPRQLSRYLHTLGATEVYCTRGGNGVEARARRPSDATTSAA